MKPAPERRVPCPSCRGSALYGPANPWRPFCSERCRSADLGAWASERFRVPAESPGDDPLAGAPPAGDEATGPPARDEGAGARH